MAISSSPSSSSSSSSSIASSNNSKAWIIHGIVIGVSIAVVVGAHAYLRRFNKFRSRVVGIIPARFASSRFSGKPLIQILGKPMIQFAISIKFEFIVFLPCSTIGIRASSKRPDQRKIENLKKFVRMTNSSSSSKFVQPAIPKFDGFYEHWAKLMENFLRSKEMWNLVKDGVVVGSQNREPTDEETKTFAEQKLKDRKVTINRDVIFEEDGCWNWGRTNAKSKSDVLDWGEAYEESLEELDENEDENTTSESEEEHLETEDSSSNEATTPPTLAKKTRKTPIYLQDYTSGGELSEDVAQIFLMFMSTDPIYYMKKQ
ncbi:hypothetical protein KIW84_056403 [Lathyrus oleraceus]|uniref:Uncharacterized protein n=1 Tax=Pisum sativum TaxID=3888 RepID=A0A9D4X0J9_PEA|nr:hypothetical protein KIW84_056403 [Pisum sativum]